MSLTSLAKDARFTQFWQRGLGYLVMITITVLFAVPVIYMLSTALRPEGKVYEYPIRWISEDMTLDSFRVAIETYPALGRWFVNSMVVALATAFLSVIIDALAAYPLARMDFFAKKFIFLGILATILIPVEATLVPLFLGLSRLKVLQTDFGTYMSLILPVVANAFGLYLLTQFFQAIPKDLEDAARIDGASDFGIWWRVILPLSGPAITAVIIFSFMASWNNFIWPFIATSTDETRTLPAGLATIFGNPTGSPSTVHWNVVMASMTLATLPPVIIFLLLQRYFVQGISMTGIKG